MHIEILLTVASNEVNPARADFHYSGFAPCR
jgi:hypothetical protein